MIGSSAHTNHRLKRITGSNRKHFLPITVHNVAVAMDCYRYFTESHFTRISFYQNRFYSIVLNFFSAYFFFSSATFARFAGFA